MAVFPEIDPARAAERLEGVLAPTPLVPFPAGDPRLELRLKLECLQETRSFKTRGAWNQVSQLTADERAAGVVAVSSGNHAQAVAWAAARAGVRATVAMPADAYRNKIEACRTLGAEVVLCPTRAQAEAVARERAAAGAKLIHPYDAARTIEGAGTVGLELLQQWPEVELVLVPVGGGGLLAGCALALRRGGGARTILGVEPEGAPTMTLGLARGEPVPLERITTCVQGLCPPAAGALNVRICQALVDGVLTLDDAAILAAQRALVREGGWSVEPAGAAAPAAALAGRLPAELLEGRGPERPLRVAAVVSGGNPAPEQLAALLDIA